MTKTKERTIVEVVRDFEAVRQPTITDMENAGFTRREMEAAVRRCELEWLRDGRLATKRDNENRRTGK